MWRKILMQIQSLTQNSNCSSNVEKLISEVWSEVSKLEFDLNRLKEKYREH